MKCSNRHVAMDACEGAFISVERLEKMVLQELKRLSDEFLDKDELERKVEFSDNLLAQKEAHKNQITTYHRKIDEFSKAIRDLYMDKAKGFISEKDYVAMSHDFIKERERLEQSISDSERQIREIDLKLAAGDNRRELIEQYTHIEHLSREMVETLIDYISVGKRIPKTRDVPIEIHWNF